MQVKSALDKQKRSLYVLSWQILRVNLDFSTIPGTKQSLQRVWDYVLRNGQATEADIYKAINLCAATVMGLEGQTAKLKNVSGKDVEHIRHNLKQRIDIIQASAQELRELHRVKGGYEINNDHRVLELSQAKLQDLIDVHTDLKKRWKGAQKRSYKVRREELREYLLMLEEELSYRGKQFRTAFSSTDQERRC